MKNLGKERIDHGDIFTNLGCIISKNGGCSEDVKSSRSKSRVVKSRSKKREDVKSSRSKKSEDVKSSRSKSRVVKSRSKKK